VDAATFIPPCRVHEEGHAVEQAPTRERARLRRRCVPQGEGEGLLIIGGSGLQTRRPSSWGLVPPLGRNSLFGNIRSWRWRVMTISSSGPHRDYTTARGRAQQLYHRKREWDMSAVGWRNQRRSTLGEIVPVRCGRGELVALAWDRGDVAGPAPIVLQFRPQVADVAVDHVALGRVINAP
jgi:hypothetical protein